MSQPLSRAGLPLEDVPLTPTEYRLLLEHSPVMIWRADRSKKCDYFNRVWLAFTGRTVAQELGDGWAEGVHPDDLGRCLDMYISSFDRRLPFEMEYRLRRYDGVYSWIFDRGVPYADDRGEFLGYIGSCVDVTERRDAEQRGRDLAADRAAHEESEKKKVELQEINTQLEHAVAKGERARSAADEAYRELDEFVALVAHDLKHPLASAIWHLQILRREASRDENLTREHLLGRLAVVQQSIEGLTAQIEELEDATRLQAGRRLDLQRAPTDLVALAQRVVLQYQDPSNRYRLHLESSATPLKGEWDAMRLERALANLLSNAVKYSPRDSEIFVRVGREGRGAVLSVEDHGIGVPTADLPHIFERYRRGSNVSQNTPGSGLGLAGVRAIVEEHGGTISVRSLEGQGATFVIWLPLEGNAAGAAPRELPIA